MYFSPRTPPVAATDPFRENILGHFNNHLTGDHARVTMAPACALLALVSTLVVPATSLSTRSFARVGLGARTMSPAVVAPTMMAADGASQQPDQTRRGLVGSVSGVVSLAALGGLPAPSTAAFGLGGIGGPAPRIADRLDATSLKQPRVKQASELDAMNNNLNALYDDLFYPEYMVGTWNVTQTLTGFSTPCGTKFLAGTNFRLTHGSHPPTPPVSRPPPTIRTQLQTPTTRQRWTPGMRALPADI